MKWGEILLSKEELETYSKEYYTQIYRYCLYFLHNKEDAEDATQETFIIFSKKAHLLEGNHIKMWLLRTAHNVVLKEYKKRQKRINNECIFKEELLEASLKFVNFEEYMVSYYGERYVQEVYNRLSVREKEMFDLFSDSTLRIGHIAKMLGLETHACSMRKGRLIEKCRDIVKDILFY